jgi:hypothetical protein
MLMVIFGAGASFDSAQACRVAYPPHSPVTGLPFRPPLANDLFADRDRAFAHLIGRYPQMHAILPLLRERSSKSVEEVLESLQNEAKAYPVGYRQLAAVRFYLRDLLYDCTYGWLEHVCNVTNYSALVDQILRRQNVSEEIAFVTFNYDLLLENALTSFGFSWSEPEAFLASHPLLKVFKLHGSVNWARFVDPLGRGGSNALIEGAEKIKPYGPFVSVNRGQEEKDGKLLFPAIAIPVQSKDNSTFACPDSHLDYLKVMLPKVTKILIIGWQAREAHFTALLKSYLKSVVRVFVISGNKAEGKSVLDHFAVQVGGRVSSTSLISQGGFTDFIVNREGDDFFWHSH